MSNLIGGLVVLGFFVVVIKLLIDTISIVDVSSDSDAQKFETDIEVLDLVSQLHEAGIARADAENINDIGEQVVAIRSADTNIIDISQRLRDKTKAVN